MTQVIVFIGVGIGLLGTRVAEAQLTKSPPLRVQLRSDKKVCSITGEATIEVTLTNITSSPIYLYAELEWGESASLSLWIRNLDSGKEVQQVVIPDALTPPASRADFIKLLPGHTYGVTLTASMESLGIQRMGDYELQVQYHSPVLAREAGKVQGVWAKENGTLTSNPVKIRVE